MSLAHIEAVMFVVELHFLWIFIEVSVEKAAANTE